MFRWRLNAARGSKSGHNLYFYLTPPPPGSFPSFLPLALPGLPPPFGVGDAHSLLSLYLHYARSLSFTLPLERAGLGSGCSGTWTRVVGDDRDSIPVFPYLSRFPLHRSFSRHLVDAHCRSNTLPMASCAPIPAYIPTADDGAVRKMPCALPVASLPFRSVPFLCPTYRGRPSRPDFFFLGHLPAGFSLPLSVPLSIRSRCRLRCPRGKPDTPQPRTDCLPAGASRLRTK